MHMISVEHCRSCACGYGLLCGWEEGAVYMRIKLTSFLMRLSKHGVCYSVETVDPCTMPARCAMPCYAVHVQCC
jgi:hypothetical protein